MTKLRCVPVVADETMHAAAEREWDGRMSARSAGVWTAMLAVAPALPADIEQALKLAEEQLALHKRRSGDGYSPVSPVVRALARALLRSHGR